MKHIAKSPTKKSKYHNVKSIVDGHKFDSLREVARYEVLRALQQSNQITELKLHPSFTIRINDKLICRYVADFSYINVEGELIVEDVKSSHTAKLPVFRLKQKLMQAVHGIEVVVVCEELSKTRRPGYQKK